MRSRVGPGDFTSDLTNRLRALYASNLINACTLRITAAAGTELAGAFLRVTSMSKGINLTPPPR